MASRTLTPRCICDARGMVTTPVAKLVARAPMIASSVVRTRMKPAGVPSKAGPVYLRVALPLTFPCSSALMAAASPGTV